jgi:hypothetical protein
VNVGRDRVRQEAVGEHGARGLEHERALAVADVDLGTGKNDSDSCVPA